MTLGKRHLELLLQTAPPAADVEAAYLNYTVVEATQVLDLKNMAELYALCDHYGIERKDPNKVEGRKYALMGGYHRSKRHSRRTFTTEETEEVAGVVLDYGKLASAIVDELERRIVHYIGDARQSRLDAGTVSRILNGGN